MQYIYRATLERVVDGDTVDIVIDLGFSTFRKERIRLYGVDAPEIKTPEGRYVKSVLIDRLNEGGLKIRTVKDRRDKYGRYLGLFYTLGSDPADNVDELIKNKQMDDSSINSFLVRRALAKERYW